MTILDPTTAVPVGTAAAPSDTVSQPGCWQDVCGLDALTVERGVAALVAGRAVALFRMDDDEVLAVDDVDPFWGVAVLSRGLVGNVGGRDTVASPLHKQRFDLRTGCCIEDPAMAVATWPVRVQLGRVEVGQPVSLLSP